MSIIRYGSNLYGQQVVLGIDYEIIPAIFFGTLVVIFFHIVYSIYKSR
jgi:hypothetical protein